MENQNRFDLNRALTEWRAELASQPGISPENSRELETHLLDTFSELKRRGLDEAEAFCKARRQFGSSTEVGAEFAKENLLRIWRDRVFWVTIAGFLTMIMYSATAAPVRQLAFWARDAFGEAAGVVVFSLVNITPIAVACALMVTGRMQILFSKVAWVFRRRWRLALFGLLLTAIANFQREVPIDAVTIYELGFLGFAVVMMSRELRAAASFKCDAAGDWRNSIGVWRDRLFWILITQLALGAWNVSWSASITAYLQHIPESERSPLPSIISVTALSIWLIPMAIVGVALAQARLWWVTRMLQSRRGAAITALALVFICGAVDVWLFQHGSLGIMPLPDWRSEILQWGISWFVHEIAFIALMLWLLRSREQQLSVEASPS